MSEYQKSQNDRVRISVFKNIYVTISDKIPTVVKRGKGYATFCWQMMMLNAPKRFICKISWEMVL